MPIYEYVCESCGHRFEKTRSIKSKRDTSKAGCNKCKGIGKKVPSLSSFHLKGGGWERDGYSKGNCDTKKG